MSTVHDASYKVLRALGMTTVFGNPGSNELPFIAQFPSDFRYVLALQEGAGLAIADGYSQATRCPVLVLLHSAAGVGQSMGSLVNAYANGTPLVVMSGQQFRPLLTMQGMLTNKDATMLPRPLVKWSFEAPTPASVPAVLARAAQCAMTAPTGPVYVSVPVSDWQEEADSDNTAYLTARHVAGRPVPSSQALKALAKRLDAAQRPVLVFGPDVDVYGGWDAGVELAERCALPVLLGSPSYSRISFPTDHVCYQGTLGITVAQVREQLDGYDLVVWIGGSALPYYVWTPGPYLSPGTDLVMVTADPDQAARAPLGDAIVGDPADALAQLVELVAPTRRPLPSPRPKPEARVGESSQVDEAQVVDLLGRLRPPNAAFVWEAPSLSMWWDQIPVNRPESFFTGGGGALGFGLPAAVGVGMAKPERPVIALIGDGSANYSITGLWTAAQQKVDCTFLIFRNGMYEVLVEYASWLGASDLPGAKLPGIDFVSLAAGYGVRGRRVSTADALADALNASFASRGPSLIEVDMRASKSGLF